MKYTEALAYLESLGTFGIQLGLARIEALLDRLDHPERRFRSVHVTGTNGKGSTTAMIAAVLTEAGIRTGMYTSPHLVDYPERMRINGIDITREAFAGVLEQTRAAAEAMIAAGQESPTEFEVLTAAAFLWFAQEQAELVVVEVGLGGLLDSTNVIVPEVSVITNVTLDHMDRCGDTVEAIAHQKAGIIKQGVPVVTGAEGAALAVIEAAAQQAGSFCEVLGRDFVVTDSGYKNGRQNFRFTYGQTAPEMYSLGMLGRHQAYNAALAVRTCQFLGRTDARLRRRQFVKEWLRRLGRDDSKLFRENPSYFSMVRIILTAFGPCGKPLMMCFRVVRSCSCLACWLTKIMRKWPGLYFGPLTGR